MKQLSLVLLLALPFATFAIKTTQHTLDQAQQSVKTINLSSVSSKQVIEKLLTTISSETENTLATSIVLKNLSLKLPNQEQREWVNAQLQSSQTIEVANPDHPNQLIEVINIARQAQNTQQQWQIIELAQQYTQRIQLQNWHWPTFIENVDNTKYLALAQALQQSDLLDIQRLQESLLENSEFRIPNRVIALLLAQHTSSELLTRLWQNPTDQYSFQVLQQVPTLFEKTSDKLANSYNQLMAAVDNENLSSQALILLAKHYADQDEVQSYLLSKLTDHKTSWHTASAVTYAKNEKFKQQVIQLQKQHTSVAVKFAAKKLAKEPLQ